MSRRPPEPTGRCVLLCSCLLSFLPAVATVDVAFGCLGVSLAILGGVKQLAIDRCDYKPHSRTNPANSHSLFLTQDCPQPVFQPSQNYRLLFLPLPPLGLSGRDGSNRRRVDREQFRFPFIAPQVPDDSF